MKASNSLNNFILSFDDPLDPLRLLSSKYIGLIHDKNFKFYLIVTIILWLLLEVIFYFLIRYVVEPTLQPIKKPLPYIMEPVALVKKILTEVEKLSKYNMEMFVKGFFLNANIEDIREENIRSFLAWVMYDMKEKDLTQTESDKISEAYIFVCHKCKLHPQPGYNPDIKHICQTWHKFQYIHRPLLLYILNGLVDFIVTTIVFRFRGFRKYEVLGVNYWYHPGLSSQHTPIVFFHGITPGWIAYFTLVLKLCQGRSIFLIELDSVRIKSMNFKMPKPETFAKAVKRILKRHNYETASFVGHSFGSITVGWVLQYYPQIVSHVTLIDPVSLLLSLPDVAYRFLYRKPKTLIEMVLYFFASTEITIAHTLHRNFHWYRSVLWLDELPSHIGLVVALAENDEIANTEAIHEYTQNFKLHRESSSNITGNVEIIHWPKFSHGQILLDSKAQNDLLKVIHRNEKLKI